MPEITLHVEMTPDEEAKLAAMAAAVALGDRVATGERKARVFADRVRTIDQIKRLYAVVLGFALTSSIANAYLCERSLAVFSWEEWSIIVAPVISSASLMVLFALGAERFLDRTYLQHDSVVPSRSSLFIDLFTLGLTAAWFVILSNIFQAPSSPGSLSLGDLRKFQSHFIRYLELFYLLDIACLGVNLVRGWGNSGHAKAHFIWIAINIVCVCLLFFWIGKISDGPVPYIGFSLVAGLLTILHVGRFALDYFFTFEFYYPTETM
jgi:hypothetical protein